MKQNFIEIKAVSEGSQVLSIFKLHWLYYLEFPNEHYAVDFSLFQLILLNLYLMLLFILLFYLFFTKRLKFHIPNFNIFFSEQQFLFHPHNPSLFLFCLFVNRFMFPFLLSIISFLNPVYCLYFYTHYNIFIFYMNINIKYNLYKYL